MLRICVNLDIFFLGKPSVIRHSKELQCSSVLSKPHRNDVLIYPSCPFRSISVWYITTLHDAHLSVCWSFPCLSVRSAVAWSASTCHSRESVDCAICKHADISHVSAATCHETVWFQPKDHVALMPFSVFKCLSLSAPCVFLILHLRSAEK